MENTKGQIRALEMLAQSEAGLSLADIGAAHGVGNDAVFFTLRFARFLRYREQHPDDRQELTAWHQMDKLWGSSTTKKAPEQTRFAEIIAALPLATSVPTKADKRSAAIAEVEAAKPPRKAKKGKPEADWPLATEAAAIIEAKAAPATEPEPASEPDPAPVAGCFTADALAALAEPISETISEPALDPAADRRAKKTLAQRLRRAAAKAAVQWRGNEAATAAAAE